MRVCTFRLAKEGRESPRLGIVEQDRVHEVRNCSDLIELARMGTSGVVKGDNHPLSGVRLFAPVPRPGKIVAAIVNTKGMLGGEDVKMTRPRLDMKAPSTVIGPGETILAPRSGIRPEVELAAVMGARVANAQQEEAKAAVFGYCVLNDVTAPADSRDDAYEAYRRNSESGVIEKKKVRGTLFRSKNHDTFCPMGPWVVTVDEAGDATGRRMTTRFDGKLVQDGNTAEYIFQPAEIASYVSSFLTLEPGDIVSCGSVGWTADSIGGLDPTEFLLPKRGGALQLEIEGIGTLTNPVVMK